MQQKISSETIFHVFGILVVGHNLAQFSILKTSWADRNRKEKILSIMKTYTDQMMPIY